MKAAIIGVAHMHVLSYLRCMKELDIDVTWCVRRRSST